ncbi:blue copper protein [Eucalyptus grandis]|uniref:blue copper protein n=1 Tax=Eucalyptus grandis TaxID=71139 RepID=UPI00192EBC06|nr:blue copper protein [Eucalyptus grandis]
MARGMNMLVLMVLLGAAIQSCSAQTTHVVGDSLGWVVPPGGAIAYSTWAANETFVVGDTLVFNFTTGMDDVAKVTKAAYDSCNSTSPISRWTNGPATITLNQSGEHFFISTFDRRCSLGEKLAINVSAASGPAPAPTTTPTPPAASAPAPTTTPTRSPVTYTVGDGVGWNVLVNTTQAYELWAANKTFMVGDILVFNFVNGTQNVAEVTKSAFDSCNITSTISVYAVPPVRITLTTPGEHFYTSTYPNRCSLGQKLAITVSAAPTPTPAPSTTPTPPAASAPAPATASATTPTRSPVTYTVGEGVGWNVLVNTTQAYALWAANKTFMVGDTLVFNFVNGTQNVAEVTKSTYDSCNTTSTISVYTVPPVRIILATPGEHFYTSTYPDRCSLGQKLAINVTGSSATTPSLSPATPPSSTAMPPSTSTSPSPPSTTTTPSPAGSATPPSPGNSAASLSVTGLFSGMLSVAVVLLY